MKIRVAVNGFGRIGRMFTRSIISDDRFDLVAINDLAGTKTLAHLFKYDSVHRRVNADINLSGEHFSINGKEIKVFGERDPEILPWNELDIDLVVECTGFFRTRALASKHLSAGTKKVIISAPAKGGDVNGYVMGINDDKLDTAEDIVSNASCTTNCVAPMVKILDDLCTIETGFITTVHSYTGDQRIHDAPHGDLRRARAAGVSIIPTTTGAATAISGIFPHLSGKLSGRGIRVPVVDGSLTELTCVVSNDVSVGEINEAFKNASQKELKGVLEYIDEPLVSVDIIGNTHSCVLDSLLTSVNGRQVQIIGWYDNEIGYSNRLKDLALKLLV